MGGFFINIGEILIDINDSSKITPQKSKFHHINLILQLYLQQIKTTKLIILIKQNTYYLRYKMS